MVTLRGRVRGLSPKKVGSAFTFSHALAANMRGSDDSNKSLPQTDRSIGSRPSWRDFKKKGGDLDLIRRGIGITNDLLQDRQSTEHLDVFAVNNVLKVCL